MSLIWCLPLIRFRRFSALPPINLSFTLQISLLFLGLRTFFFLLVELAEKFHLLKYGLAFVLSFIGFKMLLPLLAEGLLLTTGDNNSAFTQFLQRYLHHDFEQMIINISLGIVVGAIALSIIFSLMFPPAENRRE